MVAALWFGGLANYFDRTVISFAGPTIMRSLAIDARSFGIILSSFALGYVLGQIPGGLASDRWGAKPVLVVAALSWALFTGVTGLVVTVAGFIAVRVLLGISEAAGLGASVKIQGDNFAPKERSFVQGVAFTAIAIAPALAGPAIGSLLGVVSWQVTFVILATPAVIAAVLYAVFMPSGPARGRPAASASPEPQARVKDVLRDPTFWVVSLTWFMFNIAYWGFHGWMPSYLALARHIDIHKMGVLGSIPYLFAALGLLLVGWAGGGPLYRFRPQLLSASYLLAAGSLFLAYRAGSVTSSLAGLSAAGFFLFGGIGVFTAVALDLAPMRSRATYWASVSTVGQLAGVLAPAAIGYLVTATGNFASGFTFMVLALCTSAGLVLCLLIWPSAASHGDAVAGLEMEPGF